MVWRLFLQVASAVQYLHANRICHRDLKPANIVFQGSTGSCLKLVDFGLAKYLHNQLTHSLVGPRASQMEGRMRCSPIGAAERLSRDDRGQCSRMHGRRGWAPPPPRLPSRRLEKPAVCGRWSELVRVALLRPPWLRRSALPATPRLSSSCGSRTACLRTSGPWAASCTS